MARRSGGAESRHGDIGKNPAPRFSIKSAHRQLRTDHTQPQWLMATTTRIKTAKDLTREAPRSPRVRLGGYALMARMIDKGRATINGTNGEYHFDCPVDNMLFSFKGVKGDEVRQLLASGASDDDVLAWFNSHGTPKSDSEIKAWSAGAEASSLYDNSEKREWFSEECRRLGLDPARTTLFAYLEADDRQSFQKK